MKPLALRPEPVHRETLHSFVSRMAAMNRVDTVDFCVDMGFSIKKLVDPNVEVLNIIAAIGGLDVKSVSSLRAWTAEKSDDVRMIFRGEEFVSRALKNPKVRGCPICLQEDAGSHPERPLAAMAMRGDWQLREMSVCVRHKHPLVTLWERKMPVERFNIGTRLFEIFKDLQDGKFDQTQIQPSAYDQWLDQRLENGHDPTCLVDNSLYAATTFCRLLGTEMLRLRNEKCTNEFAYLRATQSTGFGIASKGKNAISDAYKELAAAASCAGELPNKAFGDLYRNLARAHRNDPAFDEFRRVLWESIIQVWPVAANEEILGFALPERKLHSLLSAAQEAKVGEKFLDQLLVEAGAYPADDTRPSSRKTFDATKYAKLIAEIPNLVGPIAMREAMGATHKQFVSLAKAKLLTPVTNISTVKSPWRIEDGIKLVNDLNSLVVKTVTDEESWEVIQQAKSRKRLAVGFIIGAVRDGRLKLGKFEGVEGYRSFCVSKAEIDKIAAQNFHENTTEQRLPPEVICTATAFGRSVGMRGNQAFIRLVRARHTPASHVVVTKSGVKRFYVTQNDIAVFHEKFVTQATMADERNDFWRTLVSELNSGGVMPFSSGGEKFGHLYLRADVHAFFAVREG